MRGVFDPLLNEHARNLAACPRPLAVQVVEDPHGHPLLPLAARQLLVAALACVDCVIPADAVVEPAIDWTREHETIRQQFIRLVHEKST